MVNDDRTKPTPMDKVKQINSEKRKITERDREFIRELQKTWQ